MSFPDQTATSVRYFFIEDEIGKLGIPKLGEVNVVALGLLLFFWLGLGEIGGKEGCLEHGGMIGCHYGRSREVYKVILLMWSKNMSCIRYCSSETVRADAFSLKVRGITALLFDRVYLSL